MKKNQNTKKLIIGIAIFALILTGTNALFTTAVDIFGSASASAEFSIEFITATTTDSEKATAIIDETSKKLNISSNLSAPGDEVTINYVMKNTGTLSATVDDVTIENNSNVDLIVEINDLDTIQGTVLTTGQEKTGSIVIKWDINSTNQNPDDATFNVGIDFSQTVN